MGRLLVAYGTSTGCTQGVADKIGDALSQAGHDVEVMPADKDPDPSGYDAVLVGSGVRAGQWHAATRSWVEAHAEALKSRPVAFFTCGLTTASDPEKVGEVRAYTDALIESTGVAPVDVGVFAGWFEPKAFKVPERLVLKMMKAPQGDFRDWDAIAAWAGAVAVKLGVTV